ncbi:hypothetical protein PMAYCL1PPCAC_23747 [Pristionchus mayeri]|uniref:BUB1 N-terminal domain-containing protein n=1 Tax=Pristionchus mayeri TaxID=1317129 RepID=A0AAN5CZW8_9BILA|nr:hypothetical protein PMAYCL1PPCAC_23747 [Pristionchus mayeri]
MSENNDDAFEWELNRENIQPLRKGRHASAVTSSRPLSASARALQAEEKMNEVLSIFEEEGGSADLLSTVLSFIAWFENHIMIGKQKLLYEFLWKCVNKLTSQERYVNDERILTVWIKLAENSLGNDCNIFDHANSIGSLKRMAKFYVEWSMACESRSQWAEARRCIERGMKAGAAPISLLHSAADELEMRMIRRETRQADEQNEDEDEDAWNDNGERRVALTRLAELEMGATPIVRLPSISGCDASSKIGPTSTKKKQENNKFEIYTDDTDDNSTWLESVYEIRNQMTKMDLVDDNTNRTCKASLNCTTKRSVNPSFTIWEEGKVEEKKKARLMLRKELIRDKSIEESLVDRYSVLFEKISPHQENRPKNLHLCKADIKPLLFD